jgi:small subunit ribosomal protein S20
MANIKSSKKDLKRNAKRRARNQATKSALKTYVKKVRQAVAAGVPENVQPALAGAIKQLDKAAQRGIIHKNQAARRKSRIAKAANAAKALAPA